MALPGGLHDLLSTENLSRRVDIDRSRIESLAGAVAERLADTLTRQLTGVLEALGGEPAEKLRRQIDLTNALRVRFAACRPSSSCNRRTLSLTDPEQRGSGQCQRPSPS